MRMTSVSLFHFENEFLNACIHQILKRVERKRIAMDIAAKMIAIEELVHRVRKTTGTMLGYGVYLSVSRIHRDLEASSADHLWQCLAPRKLSN
eukprot:5098825-Amphidinium_carterae.1